MAVQLKSIANLDQIEVGITSGPGNANRMRINTGTAVFTFVPQDLGKFNQDTLTFRVGTGFALNSFQRAIVWGAPARLRNDGTANNALWAVDQIDADLDDETREVQVTANLTVRDFDGILERMAFQVTTLFRV